VVNVTTEVACCPFTGPLAAIAEARDREWDGKRREMSSRGATPKLAVYNLGTDG